MNSKYPIHIIDNVLPPDVTEEYCEMILDSLMFKLHGGGTSGISKEWLDENQFNKQYEQFQFVNVIKSSNFSGGVGWNANVDVFNLDPWHFISLPFTLACLKLGYLYNFNDLFKCKINIQTKAPIEAQGKYNFPHTDITFYEMDPLPDSDTILTALYYANDSDGDTYLFNKYDPLNNVDKENLNGPLSKKDYKNLEIVKQISPKRGRIVLFNANQMHAGAHPVNNDKRVVINYNCKVHKFQSLRETEELETSSVFSDNNNLK